MAWRHSAYGINLYSKRGGRRRYRCLFSGQNEVGNFLRYFWDFFIDNHTLPNKYRIVVHLYYYEDYSIQEIAGILNRKETTIQTQLMRARKKLKTMLKENWNDEE